MVHKILEVIADAKIAHQNKKRVIHDEQSGNKWKVYRDGVLDDEQVDDIIEKIYAWYTSHSKGHDWDDKDYREIHKWTWKALNFRDGAFDPRKKDIVEAEARFDFEIEEPWAQYKYEYDGQTIEGLLSLKGTIDQINRIDDDTYEILDWKTGRRLNWATGEVKDHAALRKDPALLPVPRGQTSTCGDQPRADPGAAAIA